MNKSYDRKDVIDVMCMAFPDGQTIWIESDPDYARACTEAWKRKLSPETLEKYGALGLGGGVVIVRMLREDFNKIPGSNAIDWPERNEPAPPAQEQNEGR